MSFAIIDQGRRVNTPLKSIFPDKGVDKMSSGEALHSSTHNHQELESNTSEFRRILEHTDQGHEAHAPSTYEDLSPKTSAPKKNGLTAEQIMSSPVHTIMEGTTIHSAWQRMQSLSISHLMVVDAQGKTVGILSEKDLLPLGTDSTLSITKFYTNKLIVGANHTQATQIAACFLEFNINAMPIFDESEQLVGMVCRTDLLRLIISGAHIESWA